MAKKTLPATDKNDTEIVRAKTATRVEERAPEFVSVYANDIQLLTTPWDIRMRMSQIESVDAHKGEAHLTVLVDVRLSPQHAKKLSEVLVRQIEIYELSFGTIPVPKD